MTPLLKVEGPKKSFGGVAALRGARFELEAGTVDALCAGNGAGKSTFLAILMGIYRRDAGKIWRNGQEVELSSPAEALASGIAIIEQELSPIPQMTVENIFLGREPPGRFGGVNFCKMNAAAGDSRRARLRSKDMRWNGGKDKIYNVPWTRVTTANIDTLLAARSK